MSRLNRRSDTIRYDHHDRYIFHSTITIVALIVIVGTGYYIDNYVPESVSSDISEPVVSSDSPDHKDQKDSASVVPSPDSSKPVDSSPGVRRNPPQEYQATKTFSGHVISWT